MKAEEFLAIVDKETGNVYGLCAPPYPAQKCLNIWIYLEKINKQAGYKVFVYEKEKKEQEAREAERAKTRERVKDMREQKRMERELKKQDAHLYRQARLRSRYNRYYW